MFDIQYIICCLKIFAKKDLRINENLLLFADVKFDEKMISIMSGKLTVENKGTHLNIGDKAPVFRFKDECGTEMSLADMKGKRVVLFFYPKDLTPGCTLEACSLRDGYSALKKANLYIIGISADDEKRHDRFSSKYKLPFPLVADTDKKIINAYGVWGPKRFMGRLFDGIRRTTFIIDEKGNIEHIIEKVKTKNHAQQILETVKL